MGKVCEYVCDRYYHVIYNRDTMDKEQFVQGLLLNYYGGNVVLLTQKGICHIKYKDIIFMIPIEPPIDKFNKDFKELLESFKEEGAAIKDYELTIETIECYKDKACDKAGNKCDRCEAAQEYNGELWCAFDTVNRFINWDNKYNK